VTAPEKPCEACGYRYTSDAEEASCIGAHATDLHARIAELEALEIYAAMLREMERRAKRLMYLLAVLTAILAFNVVHILTGWP
jgi:hypothetical protein